MTEQQALAFRDLSRMELVGAMTRGRSLIVRLGDRMYVLSPGGLLARFRG